MNITIIKEEIPIKAWNKVLLEHTNTFPLLIETNLSKIDENNILHKKLCNQYNWHYKDSLRSLLQKMDRSLTQYEFSYYDRIHNYFNIDQINIVYNSNLIISTWDPKIDTQSKIKPCLMTMKVILEDEFLHLSVTFRARDIIRRLYFNYLALEKFQSDICNRLNKKMGLLFDYSNQASYKLDDYNKVISWKEFNGRN